MNKEELQCMVCVQYCSFYRPGKDETLACRGFIILDRLLEEQKEVPARTEEVLLGMKTEDDLFLIICSSCPFFGEDCDFAAWKRGESINASREAVNPCGGFLCLGHCIDCGTVDIQDLNRVI